MTTDHLESAKRELVKAGFYELEPLDFSMPKSMPFFPQGLGFTSSPAYLAVEGEISHKTFKGLDILEGALDGVWDSDDIFEVEYETSCKMLFDSIFVNQPKIRKSEEDAIEFLKRQRAVPISEDEIASSVALHTKYSLELGGQTKIVVVHHTDNTPLHMMKLRHMAYSGFSHKILTPVPRDCMYTEEEAKLYTTALFIREAIIDESCLRAAVETDSLHYLGLLHATGDERAPCQDRMKAFGDLAAYLSGRETFEFRRGYF